MDRMLPLAAALVMGALAQKTNGPSSLAGVFGGSGGGALAGGLATMLDRDGDGSISDDVAGVIGRFLNRG